MAGEIKKHWLKTGADTNWDTETGNWWIMADDAAWNADNKVQGTKPATNDEVYFHGTLTPTTGPAAPLTVAVFDTQDLVTHNPLGCMPATVTANIVIAAGGTLIMAAAGLSPVDIGPVWAGDASLATTNIFNSMVNVFAGAKVGDNAVFNESAYMDGGQVGDNATFNDNSYVHGGVIGNNATFNDAAEIWAKIDNVVIGTVAGGVLTWNSTGYFCYFDGQDMTLISQQVRVKKDIKLFFKDDVGEMNYKAFIVNNSEFVMESRAGKLYFDYSWGSGATGIIPVRLDELTFPLSSNVHYANPRGEVIS